jgi:hypothetical protein
VVLRDHRYREVDPGSHAGARPDAPLPDEDSVCVEPNLWELALELLTA